MPDAPAKVSPYSSSRSSAEGAVVVSSIVVLSLWGYRKLIEPHTINPSPNESVLRKIVGLEPKPAETAQFALAYGFVFFTLSVTAMAAPELATGFAILIAVGYTLTNGASVFADITSQVSKGTVSTKTLAQQLPAPARPGQPLPTLAPLVNPPVTFPLKR